MTGTHFSEMTLYNASLSFVDVHIFGAGGFNYVFSFELWWIQEEWRVCNSLCSPILLYD
jgi:hypothetical protein